MFAQRECTMEIKDKKSNKHRALQILKQAFRSTIAVPGLTQEVVVAARADGHLCPECAQQIETRTRNHHSSHIRAHISVQELASRGIRRRQELPQRRAPGPLRGGRGGKGDDGAGCVDCQDFVRRAACRVFNERGHCSNHHPLDAHIVEIPRQRCPQVGGRERLSQLDVLTPRPKNNTIIGFPQK